MHKPTNTNPTDVIRSTLIWFKTKLKLNDTIIINTDVAISSIDIKTSNCLNKLIKQFLLLLCY